MSDLDQLTAEDLPPPGDAEWRGIADPGAFVKTAPDALERIQAKRRKPLVLRSVDLSRVRPVDWLWHRRLPLGVLSLLVGEEGVGKGTLIAHVIAAVTRGTLPGSMEGSPRTVLWIGDEDSFESVVVPRLLAAGADVDMLRAPQDETRGLNLKTDALELEAAIREHNVGLIFLDALLDNLDDGLDDWRSKSVRDAIAPARGVARRTNACLLGSLHTNKGRHAAFRDLLSGTHAFNAVSRSSLLLIRDPEDERGERRICVRGKGNLSQEPSSFEFSIEPRTLEINHHPFEVPVVANVVEGDRRVADLLGGRTGSPVRDEIKEKIKQLPRAQYTRTEICKALSRDKSDQTVRRALDELEEAGEWLKTQDGKWTTPEPQT